MRYMVINSSIKLIKNNNPQYSDEQIAEIEYGLVSIYLLISKFIIILLLAYILGIVKEMLIFTCFYNLIRIPSFGLHATKSWICLVVSSIMFLGIPLISLNLTLNVQTKLIIGLITTIFIFKNSPADTYKRPIVSPTRRIILKIISTLVSITFVILSAYVQNNFISNSLLFSIIVQSFFISPTVYRIFKLPYNNYKNYILDND